MTRIKEALTMKRSQRLTVFQNIKRDGIVEFNVEEAAKESPVYQSERKQRKYTKLTKCSACSSFVSRHFFSSHKRHCLKRNDCHVVSLPLSIQNVPSEFQSDDFTIHILSKLRNDDIGDTCRNDPTILLIGFKLFRKPSHKKEKFPTICKSVRADMRSLGKIYKVSSSYEGFASQSGNSVDMFIRDNFDHICRAIEEITLDENHNRKPGLRQNIFYLVKKAVKIVKGYHYQKKNEDLCSELEKFLACFNSSEDLIVSCARYELEKTRLIKPRKPSKLPLEKDINKLHSHILSRMKVLCDEFTLWTPSCYIELRNIVLTRLTVLNGRRGGEAARLQLSDWKEAEGDNWIDKQRLECLSDNKISHNPIARIYGGQHKGNVKLEFVTVNC